MSHNASPSRPAEIATITPTALAVAGTATVTITGQHFTPTAMPVIDAALGTLVAGSVVVTWPTTTTSAMIFDVVVSTPPASPTNRTFAITQGGHATPNSIIVHGFDPGGLLSGDGMWYDSADPIAGNHVMGSSWTTSLATWKPAAGKSGANANLDCTIASPDLWGVGDIGGTKAWITWHTNYRTPVCRTLGDFVIGGNAPGAPWTMAMVTEVTGSGFFGPSLYNAEMYGLGGGNIAGNVGMMGGDVAGSYRRRIIASMSDRGIFYSDTAHNVTHLLTTGPGKRTIIGTWDGTENAGAVRLYINGVDQGVETNTVRGTQAASTYLHIDWYYTGPDGGGSPAGSDMIKCGDIFVAEKAISAGDALNLHNYWADKFNF